ncbi:MAG: SsrA-binding protein SmpB [Candidatus Nomurabacteria bacterium]|jgi:SsrA-binding protein|nr:SsrA-binding protein SmpB [Candidatus Nomurabacteria bacterium]
MSKKSARRGYKVSKTPAAAVVNRRASFDYALGKTLTVGLELTGAETKAARLGHIQLKGSYVTAKDNQLWLINASFSLPSGQRGGARAVDTRARRILAHRREIDDLIAAKNQTGITIVPLKLLTRTRYIKLVIATGKGKKQYDKREAIRRKDLAREALRERKAAR